MISLEYLAGFFDGEGYAALARIRRPGRSPEYCLRAVVHNTNLEIVSEIQRCWGGTLSEVGERRPGWKRGYALIWTNADAARLLLLLAPRLRVKARQAALLLGYQEHVRSCKRLHDQHGYLSNLSTEELRFREALFRELKELNTRDPSVRRRYPDPGAGIAPPSPPSPSYVAGFVDAEGSLMIIKSQSARDGRIQYHSRISVSNTCRSVLEDIRESMAVFS